MDTVESVNLGKVSRLFLLLVYFFFFKLIRTDQSQDLNWKIEKFRLDVGFWTPAGPFLKDDLFPHVKARESKNELNVDLEEQY